MRSLSELISLSAEVEEDKEEEEEEEEEEDKDEDKDEDDEEDEEYNDQVEEKNKSQQEKQEQKEVWPSWRRQTRGCLADRVVRSVSRQELLQSSCGNDPALAWRHLFPSSKKYESQGPAVRNRRKRHKTMSTLRLAVSRVVKIAPTSDSARSGVSALIKNTNGYDPLTVWTATVVSRGIGQSTLLADWLEALAMTTWPQSLHRTNRGRLPTPEERSFLMAMAIAVQVELGNLDYGTALISKAATSKLSGNCKLSGKCLRLAVALCEIALLFGPIRTAVDLMLPSAQNQDLSIIKVVRQIESQIPRENIDASLAVTRAIEAHEAAIADPDTLDIISSISATALAAAVVRKGLVVTDKNSRQLLEARLELRSECKITRHLVLRYAEPGNLQPFCDWLELHIRCNDYDILDDQDFRSLRSSPIAMLYAAFFGRRTYYQDHAASLWTDILRLRFSDPPQTIDFSLCGKEPKKALIRHFFTDFPEVPTFESTVARPLRPDNLNVYQRLLAANNGVSRELCVLAIRYLLATSFDNDSVSKKFTSRTRAVLQAHLALDPNESNRQYTRAVLRISTQWQEQQNNGEFTNAIAQESPDDVKRGVKRRRRHRSPTAMTY